MSKKSPRRLGRAKKAAALVPLAALSAAWTVNVLATGEGTAAASSQTAPSAPAATLPDGTKLPPATVLNNPATIGTPATSISHGKAQQLVASADASGIPAAALAAYQRAATVMDQAAPSCHLSWQLLGAIGRVESDHGRADGNTLTDTGFSKPGIYGPVLNGKNGTSLVRDTDGGTYDHDATYDRAVGPMQFLPSTWQNVAVDADGDGKRDPQDINDAALAAGVYLCSGGADLSTPAGQREAVFRYNHSNSYVTTVLGVAAAYLQGDYTSVPNATVVPDYVFAPATTAPTRAKKSAPAKASSSAPAAQPSSTPTKSTAPTKPATSSKPSSPAPTKVTDPITKVTKPVQDTAASAAQLLQVCTEALSGKGVDTSNPTTAVQNVLTKCVDQLTGDTLPEAQKNVAGVLAGLADLIQGLLGGLTSGLGGLLGGGQ